MKQTLLYLASCWCVLAFLCLPFPYHFLPNIGLQISKLLLSINTSICSWVGVDVSNSFYISDSLASYSTALILLFFSILITFMSSWKLKSWMSKIQSYFFIILIVVIAYFLIRYGIDKLSGNQFYTPASNTLHTPTGQLSKDILFWSSMGTSSIYNVFMAFIEITAGLLLLFYRTRFLGLIMSFGILLNILAINIGFDITVKYLSFLLVISTCICLCFYSSKIRFLVSNKIQQDVIPKTTLFSSKFVVLFAFLPFSMDLISTFREYHFRDSGQSYKTTTFEGSIQLLQGNEIVRIHLHPDGYIIFEDHLQKFNSHKLSNNRKYIEFNSQLYPIVISDNEIRITEQSSKIKWNVVPINLNTLNLKQDNTHWYFEKMIQNNN